MSIEFVLVIGDLPSSPPYPGANNAPPWSRLTFSGRSIRAPPVRLPPWSPSSDTISHISYSYIRFRTSLPITMVAIKYIPLAAAYLSLCTGVGASGPYHSFSSGVEKQLLTRCRAGIQSLASGKATNPPT